jgi:four helix bundle protein
VEGTGAGGVDKYSYNGSNTTPINSKLEYRNPKQIQMSKDTNPKPYDLEERTLKFAKDVRAFVKKLPKTVANIEDSRQLVKASGSVRANYIEANESISKKNFIFRIKICRKESKESRYWLRLLDTENAAELDLEREDLMENQPN